MDVYLMLLIFEFVWNYTYKCPQLRKNHDSTYLHKCTCKNQCSIEDYYYFYLFSFNGDSERFFFCIQILFYSHVFYCELRQKKKSKQQLGWIKYYTVIINLSNCYRSTWRIHIMLMGWMVWRRFFIVIIYNEWI